MFSRARIAEFIEKATTIESAGGPYCESYFDEYKFAEILINECTRLMQERWYALNDGTDDASDDDKRMIGIRVGKKSELIRMINEINQHFGRE